MTEKFDADKVYRELVPCHANPILLCWVKEQPEKCPPKCRQLNPCSECRDCLGYECEHYDKN